MIGLLGGAFDPVHCAHLRLAVEAAERLRVEAVRFVPLAGARHRAAPVAAAALRVAMLEAAIAGEPRFAVDRRELERGGVSYTVDTLRSLREELGQRPLVWLLGMDAFAGLTHWHRWTELERLAHLAVVRRPGAALPGDPALEAFVARTAVATPQGLAGRAAGGLVFLDPPLLEISGSAIREAVASGRSVRWLVPDPVLDIIASTGLYRDRI